MDWKMKHLMTYHGAIQHKKKRFDSENIKRYHFQQLMASTDCYGAI